MSYVCVVVGNGVSVPLFWALLGKSSAVFRFLTAKFVIKICDCAARNFVIKIRDCAAGNVVSFTDTVWLLGVVLVLLAVWLADVVPAWLAGEEVALPEFAGAEL